MRWNYIENQSRPKRLTFTSNLPDVTWNYLDCEITVSLSISVERLIPDALATWSRNFQESFHLTISKNKTNTFEAKEHLQSKKLLTQQGLQLPLKMFVWIIILSSFNNISFSKIRIKVNQ